ncbi:Hypothetical protein A7982_02348 [Minicystis rosea]|nr:Hypothetical protein A7982_02348 [Minicystis rosea]
MVPIGPPRLPALRPTTTSDRCCRTRRSAAGLKPDSSFAVADARTSRSPSSADMPSIRAASASDSASGSLNASGRRNASSGTRYPSPAVPRTGKPAACKARMSR